MCVVYLQRDVVQFAVTRSCWTSDRSAGRGFDSRLSRCPEQQCDSDDGK